MTTKLPTREELRELRASDLLVMSQVTTQVVLFGASLPDLDEASMYRLFQSFVSAGVPEAQRFLGDLYAEIDERFVSRAK